MSNTFDLTIAQSLYDSNDQFPVDFDDARAWIGYSRKDNALRAFLSNGFDESSDYLLIKEEIKETDNVHGSTHRYLLTVDCFKHFAMMAKTEPGKQVRRYFLQCEKSHKESAKTIELLQLQLADLQLKLDAAMSAKVSQFVGRSGMERDIQAIRCEMEQVKRSMGMDHPEEARFIVNGMVKRMVAIVKKATRKLPATFVSPGQLDLEIPTALQTSKRSKAKGGN